MSSKEEPTIQSAKATGLRRCASAGDVIWLSTNKGKKAGELRIDDIDQELSNTAQSLNLDDIASGSITFGKARPSKWGTTTTHKVIHPILEEGSSDDSHVSTASGIDPTVEEMKARPRRSSVDVKSMRGSQIGEKPKCSQSLMMRWLASSTVPPGSKPIDPCKNLAYTFKNSDINAVTPSNW